MQGACPGARWRTPSLSEFILIFLSATNSPVRLSCALYTCLSAAVRSEKTPDCREHERPSALAPIHALADLLQTIEAADVAATPWRGPLPYPRVGRVLHSRSESSVARSTSCFRLPRRCCSRGLQLRGSGPPAPHANPNFPRHGAAQCSAALKIVGRSAALKIVGDRTSMVGRSSASKATTGTRRSQAGSQAGSARRIRARAPR